MKIIITLIVLTASSSWSSAGGLVYFGNTVPTLIRVDGAVMPPRSVQQYNFAVFLAPPSTVAVPGVTPEFADPFFQLVSASNTNHASVPGRLTVPALMDVGYAPGVMVDFVVRGWSLSLGDTWDEALANWNNGSPLVSNWAIGSSTIGNDFVLGGDIYDSFPLFGSSSFQVSGFNLIAVPEPSSMALAGLGVGLAFALRRRNRFCDRAPDHK